MRKDAVVYQIYPRSFQDSDGDGIGDLPGIESRLDHLAWLGVDALWLSPIYPSPLYDFGYDVSDYREVDPTFGTLADFDVLVAGARDRGLDVLLDLVPCHTSIEHPWFREHPDWYVWADGAPPNNWSSAFGGPAWSALDGRYYLHSFYPEQPDLDWRNPEVIDRMQDVLRFWLERGVAGFRVDAIDRLLKDPQLRDDPPASEPFGLPLREDEAQLALTYSRNAPDTGEALAKIREAVGEAFLVGEVYLPSAKWQPYLHFDAASPSSSSRALGCATCCVPGNRRHDAGQPGAAWVHVQSRLWAAARPRSAARTPARRPCCCSRYLARPFSTRATRSGRATARPAEKRFDRAGRDRFRHPIQWDRPARPGRLHDGDPWLPVDRPDRQRGRPGARCPALARACPRPGAATPGPDENLRAARRSSGRVRLRPRRTLRRHQLRRRRAPAPALGRGAYRDPLRRSP